MPDDTPITSFMGDFAFLSNFHPHPVGIDGDTYPTNEHAFQALKTLNPAERERVRLAKTPASAIALGKRVTLREDWDTLRFEMMEQLVRAKFTDADLAAMLLATGERELIEGSTWRDTTWGCIRTKDGEWKGRNELGRTPMGVRTKLQPKKELRVRPRNLPIYNLTSVRSEFSTAASLQLMPQALQDAALLGWDKEAVVAVVQSMGPEHYRGSVVSGDAVPHRRDIYHAPSPVGILCITIGPQEIVGFSRLPDLKEA